MNPKRALALLATPVLALSCLGVAACGSKPAAQPETTAATTTAETTSALTADPTQKFIGSYKLAAANYQDVVLAGDLSSAVPDAEKSTLEIKTDNTGTITFAESTVPFDWKLKDDNTLDLTLKGESNTNPATITYEDNALKFLMTSGDESMTLYFTPDGIYSKAKVFSIDQGTAITNEADLIGTWKITGANYNGATAYGSSESLSKLGMGDITTVTFEPGGAAKIGDAEGTWVIDSSGAAITTKGGSGDVKIPVKKLDNDLIIDASNVVQGINVSFLLSK